MWRQWDRLVIVGGLLFRKYEENNGDILHQLVTPADRHDVVLKLHHDVASGGHLGVKKNSVQNQKSIILAWYGR